MNRIAANGIEIAYRFDGPDNGPCVMLCNGIMSNFSMWDRQVPALADRYRVLRFDNRGHGGTRTHATALCDGEFGGRRLRPA